MKSLGPFTELRNPSGEFVGFKLYNRVKVMYKTNRGATVDWTIAEARRRFADLLSEARRSPQPIYRRNQLVGAVIGPEELAILECRPADKSGSESIASSLAELRQISAAEKYALKVPPRRNRRTRLLK